MADPLTGLATVGAVSALLQVIDFSAKVIKETKKLVESSDDALRENIIVERLTLEHANLADRLIAYNTEGRELDANERAVDKLAQECKTEAAKLLNQLNQLKIDTGLTGAKRVWQTARMAQKALRQRKAIQQQQRYLGQLHNQLSTQLLHILRITQLSVFENLLDRLDQAESKNASAVLESKQAILGAVEAWSKQHSTAAQGFTAAYFKLEQRMAQQGEDDKKQLILESLHFAEMRQRRQAIPKAYQDTFEWIFTNTASPFLRWLTSNEDMFWISGKAGSGKSTLMKYLSAHKYTKYFLRQWAGNDRFVLVDSYLWNPGTAMQRSERGMLQEILYQILSRDVDLIKAAFPDRWEEDLSNLRKPEPWSRDELLEALQIILKQDEQQTRYFFAIDGLDEYSGEDDRTSLVETIQWLAKLPGIKMCVSSRPWNVFSNAFERLPGKLYLEDITREDISLYIHGRLTPLLRNRPNFTPLVTRIIDKAQGVFLWVFLVVRSLREGLEEGDSITILHKRLEEFPSDLEDYFRLIMSRVSKTYRKQTSQALKMASMLIKDDSPHQIYDSPTFLSFWLLSQGTLDGPDFAFDFEMQEVGQDEVEAMALDTKRFLNACCKDFLYLSNANLEMRDDGVAEQVDFLHRTVYDFLQNDDVSALLNTNVPLHFKEKIFLPQLALARSKISRIEDKGQCAYNTRVIESALQFIAPSDIARRLVSALEIMAIRCFEQSCSVECELHKVRYMLQEEGVMRRLISCFIAYHCHSYLKKILKHDPTFIQTAETDHWTSLEAVLGLSSYCNQFPLWEIDIEVLRTLLQHNARFERKGSTTWCRFLWELWRRSGTWTGPEKEQAARIVHLLLRSGADVDAEFEFDLQGSSSSVQKQCMSARETLEIMFDGCETITVDLKGMAILQGHG